MMEFNDNKPIYKQIVEYSFNCILDGTWSGGTRVPSVRELAAELGVNSRTVLKAMEDLQNLGIIEPKRGMGFLLADDAPARIKQIRKQEFFEVTLPALVSEMRRLEIAPGEIIERLVK